MKKRSIIALLAILVFFSACESIGEDSSLKDKNYYDENKKEAKDRLNWCLKKANLSSDFIEKIKKLDEEMEGIRKGEIRGTAGDILRKHNLQKSKIEEYFKAIEQVKKQGIIDEVNQKNCEVVINYY